MSGFIRFIGSLFIFAWIAITFLGIDLTDFTKNDQYSAYLNDVMSYKWLLLVLGIILSVLGTITKVKKQKQKSAQKHRVNGLSEKSQFIKSDSTVVKKDFIAEQHRHKVDQFVSKQQGHLKEIALKVDWTPLRSGGANFKTSSLKRVSSSRLETTKSKGGIAFASIFAIIGLGVMFGGSYIFYAENGLSLELLFPVLFGSVFAAVGIGMLIWPRPRIFDLRQGWFWAGSKSLQREQKLNQLKKSARLSDIAAIQVISEKVSGNKGGSYTSWEINLVSKDGQRLNVMDHGNKLSILDDAQFIGEFLGVPVWENT